jgi:hypothetical protein
MGGQTMVSNSMGVMLPGSGLIWTIGLYVLGATLLVVAIASVSRVGREKMTSFGALMALYGAIMLVIGSLMFFNLTPMTQDSAISGLAMLVLGSLMILNGVLMIRAQRFMAPMRTSC